MIETLQEGLLLFTQALLVPTIIALGVGTVVTFALLGGLIGEAWSRRRSRPPFTLWLQALLHAPGRRPTAAELPAGFGPLGRLFETVRRTPASADKALDDLHLRVERHLDFLGLAVRVGPMLGLAGTLIPIGPALVALSTGDIESLTRQLVVAFGTTVVGLLIAGGCAVVHARRRAWYDQDLDDARYVIERLAETDGADA